MRMFGIVNLYGKRLEPCFKQLGVHSTIISIDYYRFVEVILELSRYLLVFVIFAMFFRLLIIMLVGPSYWYELINELYF